MHRSSKLPSLISSFVLGVGILSVAPSAHAISFDTSWTGSNDWSLSGMFSYDDSLINTGAITGNELDSLMFEVFNGNTSQGVWNLGDPQFSLNFNFDTTTETFVVGGNSNFSTGQRWGAAGGGFPASAVGFESGGAGQGVWVGSNFRGFLTPITNSTLTATRKQTQPIPTPALLPGLIGMGFSAIRKRRQEA